MPTNNFIFELAEGPLITSHPMVLNQVNQTNHAQQTRRSNDTSHLIQPYNATRTAGAAAQLNQHLHPVDAPEHHLETWHEDAIGQEASSSGSNLGLTMSVHLPRLAKSVGSMMQPQGDTCNDDGIDQRIFNLLTSAPFFVLGAHMLRKYETPEAREYGYSMLAVGAAATLYHATSGRLRRLCRKLDYWTIAASSTSMSKAIFQQKPWLHRSLNLSLLAIPFKPFVISTAHTLVMQGEFARQAIRDPSMRPHFARHSVAAAASGLAFAVEDILAEKGFGHVHGLWHLLAAAGVATTGALVEHKEKLRLAGDSSSSSSGSGESQIGGLRSYHDSVSSLKSFGRSYDEKK